MKDRMKYGTHIEKYKATDVGGIHKEQFREYANPSLYHNDVDPSRTHENVSWGDSDWRGRINAAKEKCIALTGKKMRKDAVMFCSAVTTVPGEWGKELAEKYFRDYSEWYKKFLQEHKFDQGCELSCVVHFDETNPHMTQTYMPLSENKFVVNKLMNKVMLQQLAKQGWQFTEQWMEINNVPEDIRLESPAFDAGRKHLSEAQYKLKQVEKELAIAKSKLEVYESLAPEQKKIFQKKDSVTVDRNEYEAVMDARDKFVSAAEDLAKQKEEYKSMELKLSEREELLVKKAEIIQKRDEKSKVLYENQKQIILNEAERMIAPERESLQAERAQLEDDKKNFWSIVESEVEKRTAAFIDTVQEKLGSLIEWVNNTLWDKNTTVREEFENQTYVPLDEIYDRTLS